MKTSYALITIVIALVVGYGVLALIKQTTAPSPMTTPTELGIEVHEEGSGAEAQNGQVVDVHYTGMLTDGTVFDSSIARGTPISFTLGVGQVIQGWDLGILGMKVGEKRTLTIPSELGYGAGGAAGGLIPPNATLIFDVELVGIQ